MKIWYGIVVCCAFGQMFGVSGTKKEELGPFAGEYRLWENSRDMFLKMKALGRLHQNVYQEWKSGLKNIFEQALAHEKTEQHKLWVVSASQRTMLDELRSGARRCFDQFLNAVGIGRGMIAIEGGHYILPAGINNSMTTKRIDELFSTWYTPFSKVQDQLVLTHRQTKNLLSLARPQRFDEKTMVMIKKFWQKRLEMIALLCNHAGGSLVEYLHFTKTEIENLKRALAAHEEETM